MPIDQKFNDPRDSELATGCPMHSAKSGLGTLNRHADLGRPDRDQRQPRLDPTAGGWRCPISGSTTPAAASPSRTKALRPTSRWNLIRSALDRGQDTQLEAAIGVVLQQLESADLPARTPPPYPTEIGK